MSDLLKFVQSYNNKKKKKTKFLAHYFLPEANFNILDLLLCEIDYTNPIQNEHWNFIVNRISSDERRIPNSEGSINGHLKTEFYCPDFIFCAYSKME